MAAKSTAKEDTTTLSLVTKLSRVMASVGTVEKKGYNDHHNYKYVMEPELFDSIRGGMSEYNLMLIPTVERVDRAGGIATITMCYKILDGDSGDSIEIPWVAEGQDSGDKGINKALTSASKFLISKMFLCVTDDHGEPPDAENQNREARPTRSAPPRNVTTTELPGEMAPDVKGDVRLESFTDRTDPDTGPSVEGSWLETPTQIKKIAIKKKRDGEPYWSIHFTTDLKSDGEYRNDATVWDRKVYEQACVAEDAKLEVHPFFDVNEKGYSRVHKLVTAVTGAPTAEEIF